MLYITTNDLNHQQWLDERRKGIGGSDVAAIIGASKYKTPLDIYNDKLGLSQPTKLNDFMLAGIMLEETISNWYAEVSGKKVIRDNKIRYHKRNPFLLANVDRVILPQGKEGRGILEIKTSSAYMTKSWEAAPPIEYQLQLQHYLNVLDLNWGEFAVLIGGNDFRRYFIQRDQELIDLMNVRLKDFWENNVLKQVPPPPVNTNDLSNLYQHIHSNSIEATNDDIITVNKIKELNSMIKDLEIERDNYIFKIKSTLKDSDTLTLQGDVISTWKQSKDSVTFNTSLFKSENPLLYEKYLVSKTGSRRFIIK